MNKLIILFTALLLLSCASTKVLDQQGDKSLKTQQKLRESHYLGISESRISYDDALQKAITQAQTMIVNELGVDVRVATNSVERIYEQRANRAKAGSQWVEYWLSQDIQLESEHNIKTKISRLYYEKTTSHTSPNIEVYKVWVELYFDKDDFYRKYRDFWASIVSGQTDQSLTGQIQHLERLLPLRDRYEKEKQYLSPAIVSSYEALLARLPHSINTHLRNTSIQNTARNHKFSNKFTFRFIDKTTNQPLPNLPVTIIDKPFITDRAGNINYEADYGKPITIYLGHTLHRYINAQIYHNDTFSPFTNKNVSIAINCTNANLRNTFSTLLTNRQYKTSSSPDITLEIIPTQDTKMVSVNQYLTELRLQINLKRNNRTVHTIYIPSNRNEHIVGYGTTQNEALQSAFSLQWHNQKEQDIVRIERAIGETLIQ